MDLRPLALASLLLLAVFGAVAEPVDAAGGNMTVYFKPVDGITVAFEDGVPVASNGTAVRVDRGSELRFTARSEKYDLSRSGISFYDYDLPTGVRGSSVISLMESDFELLGGYTTLFIIRGLDRDATFIFHDTRPYLSDYDPYGDDAAEPEPDPVRPAAPDPMTASFDPSLAAALPALGAAMALLALCLREYRFISGAGRGSP